MVRGPPVLIRWNLLRRRVMPQEMPRNRARNMGSDSRREAVAVWLIAGGDGFQFGVEVDAAAGYVHRPGPVGEALFLDHDLVASKGESDSGRRVADKCPVNFDVCAGGVESMTKDACAWTRHFEEGAGMWAQVSLIAFSTVFCFVA